MLKQLRPALVMIVVLTVDHRACSIPLVITGIGAGVFPAQANGSLIERDGQVVGSALIGQPFATPGYFQAAPRRPRPSPTTPPPRPARTSARPTRR